MQEKCYGFAHFSTLLKHVTMPWFHCKLVSDFVFKCWTFFDRRDQKITQITGSDSKCSWINMLLVLFHSRINNDAQEVVCWELLWCQYSSKLFQENSPWKSDFVTKNLGAPRLWEFTGGSALSYPELFWTEVGMPVWDLKLRPPNSQKYWFLV